MKLTRVFAVLAITFGAMFIIAPIASADPTPSYEPAETTEPEATKTPTTNPAAPEGIAPQQVEDPVETTMYPTTPFIGGNTQMDGPNVNYGTIPDPDSAPAESDTPRWLAGLAAGLVSAIAAVGTIRFLNKGTAKHSVNQSEPPSYAMEGDHEIRPFLN